MGPRRTARLARAGVPAQGPGGNQRLGDRERGDDAPRPGLDRLRPRLRHPPARIPEHGRLASFTLLLAVFADDTFAYLGGRALGRHKLAPALSPGKTLEGFVVGSIACVFVTFVALYHDRATYLSIGQALLLGLVIAVAAAAGDLFESMLKRDIGAKDTGALLGGHGGCSTARPPRLDPVRLGRSLHTILAYTTSRQP